MTACTANTRAPSGARVVLVSPYAVGLPLPLPLGANDTAAGVMMIPIPASGIFRGIDGLDTARAVPHITGIEITAPPEGAGYLGFLFSRAATAQQADAALVVRIQPLVEP